MKMVDLIRIIGILLDNAVEACQECEKPSIILSMIKMSRNVTIIVKNTLSLLNFSCQSRKISAQESCLYGIIGTE